MATATLTKPAAKGGSFLLESPQPGDVFTPADLSDDQRLIGQTAEEFVLKEVFPLIKDLENKKAGLMASLVKKGGEVGLMGGGVPEEYGGAGLDKISTTVLTEKLSIYGGFADVYIVFAKVDGEKFTAFIVERTFPGFKPGNEEHKMGIHGSSTTPIFLENCKVPKENLLHEI